MFQMTTMLQGARMPPSQPGTLTQALNKTRSQVTIHPLQMSVLNARVKAEGVQDILPHRIQAWLDSEKLLSFVIFPSRYYFSIFNFQLFSQK